MTKDPILAAISWGVGFELNPSDNVVFGRPETENKTGGGGWSEKGGRIGRIIQAKINNACHT